MIFISKIIINICKIVNDINVITIINIILLIKWIIIIFFITNQQQQEMSTKTRSFTTTTYIYYHKKYIQQYRSWSHTYSSLASANASSREYSAAALMLANQTRRN